MRKEIVLVIICLFIGASFVPIISGDYNNSLQQNQTFSSNDIDWWPMAHHDLKNTCFSTSETISTNDIKWSFTAHVKNPPIVYEKKSVCSQILLLWYNLFGF